MVTTGRVEATSETARFENATIGERSFIAAGAVVVKDVPPRSLVVGVPGRISPLLEGLDRPNHPRLTIQTLGIWHPEKAYEGEAVWPDDWPEKFS